MTVSEQIRKAFETLTLKGVPAESIYVFIGAEEEKRLFQECQKLVDVSFSLSEAMHHSVGVGGAVDRTIMSTRVSGVLAMPKDALKWIVEGDGE